jgi:hypothetical protein
MEFEKTELTNEEMKVFTPKFLKIFMIMFLLICILILSSIYVSATPTQINTDYVVVAEVKNGSNYLAVDNATLNIYYPNGSAYITNLNMTYVGVGQYRYSFIPMVLGVWTLQASYNLNGSVLGTSSDTLEVLQNYVGGSTQTMNLSFKNLDTCPTSESQMIFLLGLCFLVVIAFGWGFKQKSIITMATCGLFVIGISFILRNCLEYFGTIGLIFGLIMIVFSFVRGRNF